MKTPETTKEERELILGCQRGDRQAFEALYLKYHRGLYSFLLSMLRSPETAEDVTQDVFVKLFNQIQSYRFQSPFAHWLFRMARNAAIDRFRREKVRRATSLDADSERVHPLQEVLPSNSPLPSARSESQERAKAVREAVLQLPENYQTVVMLREWDELSYEEIARQLDISEGTVKSRLFRARQMLADLLKEYL